MPYVEYYLLLKLICLMKSGISLDLGKNWVIINILKQVFGRNTYQSWMRSMKIIYNAISSCLFATSLTYLVRS